VNLILNTQCDSDIARNPCKVDDFYLHIFVFVLLCYLKSQFRSGQAANLPPLLPAHFRIVLRPQPPRHDPAVADVASDAYIVLLRRTTLAYQDENFRWMRTKSVRGEDTLGMGREERGEDLWRGGGLDWWGLEKWAWVYVQQLMRMITMKYLSSPLYNTNICIWFPSKYIEKTQYTRTMLQCTERGSKLIWK